MEREIASTLNTTMEKAVNLNFLDQHDYLIVYSILVGAVIVIVSGSSFLFFRYCMQVGISLHDSMFSSLVRAPTSFFDANPAGTYLISPQR
jgi:ATP-binding cassette subfamily C (CFTR/MRP) protein 4